MCYSSTAVDVYPRTHSALSSRVVKAMHGSRKQKCETRQTPIASNTLDHPPTHRPNHPPTHQPTHPRCATAIQQSTAADALIQTEVLCRTLGFPFFDDYPPSRRASDPSPYNAPRSPSWAGHPLFAGDREGLLCGWDVSGARNEWSSRLAAVFWVLHQIFFQRSQWLIRHKRITSKCIRRIYRREPEGREEGRR